MARIRSVKPEFWTDRKLSRLTRDARLLYLALWNQADEWARVHGDTRYVKGHCLPYDDDLSLSAVDRLLAELDNAGHVQRYEVEGDPYLFLPKLGKHQRLEPAKVPSRLPDPPKPGAKKSAPRADTSAPDPHEKSTEDALSGTPIGLFDEETAGQSTWSEPRADSSERRADSSATIVALHVAGSRGQVAGSRDAAQDRGADGTAAAIVSAYVDACREVGQIIDPRAKGRIAKEAAQLLKDGAPHAVLVDAACRLAANGFADLGAEARRVLAQPRPATGRIAEGDEILREAFNRGQAQRAQMSGQQELGA